MPQDEITHRKGKETTHSGSSNNAEEEKPVHVDKVAELVWWLTYELPPNIKTFKLKHYANALKATVLPYMLFLMWYHNNWSLGCWVYMALHGSYGFLWNLKTLAFPDKSHEGRVSLGSVPQMLLVIFMYWYIAYMMASGQSDQNPSPERIFWSVLTFVIGAAFMMISDAQKYYCLRLSKGLIDYGMFAHTRNPNYLGECMIYGSMAMLSNRTLPWIILLSIWFTIFLVFIVLKERSFRRKAGWEEYRKKSYIFFPKLFGSDILSLAIYGFALYAGITIYNKGGLFPILSTLKV